MNGTKIAAILIMAATMMLASSGSASAASISDVRDVQVDVLTGSTMKLDGGDWVAIKAGDVVYGVVYGTESNLNNIYLFTDQKRYLGGVDLYDDNGDFLRSQGIPIDLIFATKLVNVVEFNDMNGDGLFDLRWLRNMSGLGDKPVKAASLKLPWTMTELVMHEGTNVTTVDFALTATDVPYTWVWPNSTTHARQGIQSDGSVSEITFTCHLRFSKENKTIEGVPWYSVTVKNGEAVNSTYEGRRNYTSDVLNGTIKYDQSIQGWDFASNDSKLAVEVGIIAGVHAKGAVAEKLRERYQNMQCEMNGTGVADSRGSGPAAPLVARDTLRLQSEWERIGNVSWVSNATVDGQQEQMKFQVQNGGAYTFSNENNAFVGFMVIGAFIYPAGNSIFHDPELQSAATTLVIGTTGAAFPKAIVFIQLLVVIIGVALAVVAGIFIKRHSDRGRSPASVTRQKPSLLSPRQPPMQPPYPPLSGGKEQ